MPEGDTIFKAARTLHRALAGQTVTRFHTGLVQLARVDIDTPLAGREIEHVDAMGKHLLMTFSGGLVLRTHMRMNGSWHIYRRGERWQLPYQLMRIVIETEEWEAVAFRVHVAEFVKASDLPRHRPIASLGPDLLSPDFDARDVVPRIREGHNNDSMAEILLNQRLAAGIGNVYKSEILFLAAIHPDTLASTLPDDVLEEVLRLARKLLRDNVAERAGPSMVTYQSGRRTTGRMRPEDRLWVYSRGGKPCRRCGTTILSRKTGDDARVTYWCPSCQVSSARAG